MWKQARWLVFGSALAAAATQQPGNIRVDANLVLVPVTVTDRRGATVTGLRPEQFQILEDRKAQPIVSFSAEDAPCSIGVVFDLSGSMKTRIADALASSRALFRSADPEDEAFLIAFSNHPEIQAAFTSDFGAILRGLQRSRPGGRTALIDSVYLGLDRMRAARHARKALIVISDGMDNHSRFSKPELMTRAVESDTQIYTVAVFDPPREKKPIELDQERRGLALLSDLAENTGGLHFTIRDPAEIAAAAAKIGRALHQVYLIGYRPPETREGWRKIQVRLAVPHVKLYTRAGYYAR